MIKCVMLNAHCTLITEVVEVDAEIGDPNCKLIKPCLLYTSPSPRDRTRSRMPSSA